jgi:indolepyruvate ferredoxin oxidoreductase beta subunit
MKGMTSILIAGVGGQGTLLAGKILGEYANLLNLDVKVSEVHGMAQRGGCVVTHVRMGENVHSPLIEPGHADALLAFEPVEALRHLHMLKPDGVLVASSDAVKPPSVSTGNALYPQGQDIEARADARAGRSRFISAGALAREAGSGRTANVVLLGALTRELNLYAQTMRDAVERSVRPAYAQMNRNAFDLGLRADTDLA